MELQPLDIVIHLINIVLLFVVLRSLVYKPVVKFMRARTEKIEQQLLDAKASEEQALVLKEQSAQELANCDGAAKQILRDSTQKANEAADNIIDEAHKQAENIISEAQAKATADFNKKLDSMKDEIAEISVEIAKKILQREIKLDDNKYIINDFFKKAE